MFFYLSKVLWWLTDPVNVLFGLLILGVLLMWTPWRRFGRRLTALIVGLFVLIAVLPIGPWLFLPLENRFPQVRVLPERVDGVIVLGGMVQPVVSQARGEPALTGAAERLTAFAELARAYPDATLVFTGGSGDIFNQEITESSVIGPAFEAMGIEAGRVVYERRSRNTFENARLTLDLLRPGADERWVLVTSAAHMPRAVGCFRQVGWPDILPYPVDYELRGDETFHLSFDLSGGLSALSDGVHEWLGLIFYRLTGKTRSLFPGPGTAETG